MFGIRAGLVSAIHSASSYEGIREAKLIPDPSAKTPMTLSKAE